MLINELWPLLLLLLGFRSFESIQVPVTRDRREPMWRDRSRRSSGRRWSSFSWLHKNLCCLESSSNSVNVSLIWAPFFTKVKHHHKVVFFNLGEHLNHIKYIYSRFAEVSSPFKPWGLSFTLACYWLRCFRESLVLMESSKYAEGFSFVKSRADD